MLSAREKRRIRTSLPDSFTVNYTAELDDGTLEDRTTTVEPAFRWTGSDSTGSEDEFDSYPIILLAWQAQGEDIPNEAVLNYLAERIYDDSFDPDDYDIDLYNSLIDEGNPDDEVFVEVSETRYQAELQVTPVVETKWVDGVPPQPRTETMARELWKWVEFSGSRVLNSVGSNGERPIVVEPSSSPTPARAGGTYRAPMTALMRHTSSFNEVIPVADEVPMESDTSDEDDGNVIAD